MNDLKEYTFRVRWSEEDGKWVGQCPAFMQLHFLHEDPVKATEGIMLLVRATLATVESAPKEKSLFQGMDDMLSGAPGPFGR